MPAHTFRHIRLDDYERDVGRMQGADEYTLRHLALHLHAAGQREQLYGLLLGNYAWMDVKHARLNGDNPYVGDIDLALSDFADPLAYAQLPTLIQLHTARQAVNHRVNIDVKYLDILTWLDQEEEAIAIAQLIGEPLSRFSSLLTIYEILVRKGRFRPDLLNMLKNTANEMPITEPPAGKEYYQFKEIPWFETLNQLVTVLARIGDDQAVTLSDQVLAFFEARPYLKLYSSPTSGLFDYRKAPERGLALVLSGRFAEAVAIELSVPWLCQMAVALFVAGNERAGAVLGVAETRARQAHSRSQSLKELIEVALAARKVADPRAAGLWDEIIQIAVDGPELRIDAYVDLGDVLEGLGDSRSTAIYRRAIAVISHDRARTIPALLQLGTIQARIGDHRAQETFDQAIEAAKALDWYNGAVAADARAWALSIVGVALARLGDRRARIAFDTAIDITRTLSGSERLHRLQNLTSDLAREGDNRAREVFDDLREVARAAQADEQWPEISALGAGLLIQVRQFDEALAQVQALKDEKVRSTKLQELAMALAQAGGVRAPRLFDQAIAAVHSLEQLPGRVAALQGLGEALAQAGDSRASAVFSQAIELAHTEPNEIVQLEALKDLAAALARSGYARSGEIFDEIVARTNAMIDAPPEFLLELGSALATVQDSRADSVLRQAIERVRAHRSHGGDVSSYVSVLSDYTLRLIKAGLLDEAKERGLHIGGPGSAGSVARAAIATAFARAGRFDDARQVLQVMQQYDHESYQSSRDGYRLAAIRDVAIALVQTGQLDAAQAMVASIDNPYRLHVLCELASTYLIQGDDRAQEMLVEVTALARFAGAEDRNAVLRKLALALTRTGHWKQALGLLGPFSLSGFFQLLGECLPLLEKLEPALPVDVLFATTAIAGWLDVNWRRIHSALPESRHDLVQ